MGEVIAFVGLTVASFIVVMILFNGDWIAPGGWISWWRCRFPRRRHPRTNDAQ